MVYVIEGGSGHCHEAGLTVLISIILQVRETVKKLLPFGPAGKSEAFSGRITQFVNVVIGRLSVWHASGFPVGYTMIASNVNHSIIHSPVITRAHSSSSLSYSIVYDLIQTNNARAFGERK
jgi:hypothetical protein